MPNKRGISPLTTWHSQGGLLLISATWGLSYMMPRDKRIVFSEVFPETLHHGFLPMWGWGVILMVSAIIAFTAERVIAHTKGRHPLSWRLGWGAHMILAGAYFTLAATALFDGWEEVQTRPMWSVDWTIALLSAISRPVLWSYIGYLHSTYARLPRPQKVSS